MQKELEKLHRNFQTQYLLFQLCTFPFNVKMPHLKKKTLDQKNPMVSIPETCNTGFFLTSLEE